MLKRLSQTIPCVRKQHLTVKDWLACSLALTREAFLPQKTHTHSHMLVGQKGGFWLQLVLHQCSMVGNDFHRPTGWQSKSWADELPLDALSQTQWLGGQYPTLQLMMHQLSTSWEPVKKSVGLHNREQDIQKRNNVTFGPKPSQDHSAFCICVFGNVLRVHCEQMCPLLGRCTLSTYARTLPA